METQIINVNQYRLVGSADSFVEAISALANRTEHEGVPGVLRYSFYVDPEAETAGAVIVYADPDAWIRHHELAAQWEEMGALQSTVALEALTWFGPVTDEIRRWVGRVPVDIRFHGDLAAGFRR